METTTYNKMDYQEFDKLIKKYFPKATHEFVAAGEMSNDTDKDMGEITKKDYTNWTESDHVDFNNIILGKDFGMYRSYLILQYFVGNDILPEGNYLISVCW